jgi:hypothetical protein
MGKSGSCPKETIRTMLRRAIVAVLLSLTLYSVAALAADKPDFSGTWKLNVAKSDFGPMPKPERVEYVLAHKDPELIVKSTAVTQSGEVTNESKIITDGTEFTNELRGQQITGTAKWEGKTLVVTRKTTMQGTDLVLVQRWTLAEDGKSIAQEVSITTPQGELQQKVVLDKIEGVK